MIALTLFTAEVKDVALTTYVVADLNSEAGQALVKEALAATVRTPLHLPSRNPHCC